MTFYNVISGILFLGACEAFLKFIHAPAWWAAATLVIIVCNEAIMTSDLVERPTDPVKYGMHLKMLDLVAFSLLASALLVLRPDAFDTGSTNANSVHFPGQEKPSFFLWLLGAYWGVTVAWNRYAGQNVAELWGRLRHVPAVFAFLFALAAIPAHWLTSFSSPRTIWIGALGALVLAYLLLKLAYSRGRLRWLLDEPPARRPRLRRFRLGDLTASCTQCSGSGRVQHASEDAIMCNACAGNGKRLTPAGEEVASAIRDVRPAAVGR